PFDYIICHGVFSWVPEQVQDKILDVCGRLLRPDGIAYVSYNTYPGWHMRRMIREMLVFHVSRFPGDPPQQRIDRARGLLDFLARSVPQSASPYGLLLQEQRASLSKHSDSYLFHEHLEEHNEPLYFLQFCERAGAHGLRYLGEAEFPVMVASTSFAPEVQQGLAEMTVTLLEKEQYMDFLRNRTFRQTLLCHSHQRPRYAVRADQLTACHVAAPVRPQSAAPDLRTEAVEEFLGPGELRLSSTVPLVKAALVCLGEAWPRAIAFDRLLALAWERLGTAVPPDPEVAGQEARAVGKALLTSYATAGEGLVELSLRPPEFTTEVSERPRASPLARLQARTTSQVTNLRHEVV